MTSIGGETISRLCGLEYSYGPEVTYSSGWEITQKSKSLLGHTSSADGKLHMHWLGGWLSLDLAIIKFGVIIPILVEGAVGVSTPSLKCLKEVECKYDAIMEM